MVPAICAGKDRRPLPSFMPLSAVIVDDEQLARDELAYLLKNVDDVNVVEPRPALGEGDPEPEGGIGLLRAVVGNQDPGERDRLDLGTTRVRRHIVIVEMRRERRMKPVLAPPSWSLHTGLLQ